MARSGNRRDLFIQVSGNVDPLRTSMKAGQSVLAEFGTAAIDVQAEVKRALDNLGNNAPASARKLEQSFARTFDAIRANAQAALNAPTGTAAIEILNAAGARQSAEAAEAKARALRILADAAVKADAATDGLNVGNRLFAVTAEAAAQGARDEALALRAQSNVMNGVEAQIEGVTNAKRRNVVVSGQARAGMQQLSFQLGDVATSFAAGTPPAIIFAQQIGQVSQAFSLMTTKTTGFIGFLGGPWGIGLSSALVLLTPFVAKLFEEGEAADKAAQELEKNRIKTKEMDEAKAAYARTASGVIDAISKETDELERQNRSLEDNVRLKQAQLRDQLGVARGNQANTLDQLRAERAELAAAEERFREIISPSGQAGLREGAAVAIASAQARIDKALGNVAALEAQLSSLDKSVIEAEQNIRLSGIPLAEQQAREAVDPLAAINGQYDRMAEAAKEAARYNDDLAASLGNVLAGIERQRKAATETERKRQSDAGKGPSLAPVTSKEIGSSLLEQFGGTITNTKRSPAQNKAAGGGVNSFHLIDQAVDFVPKGGVNSISKAEIRVLLEADGVSIKELLGPGDKDHDDHFHIAFDKKRLTPDRIAKAAAKRGPDISDFDLRDQALSGLTEGAPFGIFDGGEVPFRSLVGQAIKFPGTDDPTGEVFETIDKLGDRLVEMQGEIPDLASMLSIEDQQQLLRFSENFHQQLAGGLTDAILYGEDLGDVLENTFKRAAAALLESGLLNLLSGGQQGLNFGTIIANIGKIFGGGRASGGGIDPDKFYLVGEDGPELFAPGVAGNVISNSALRSASMARVPQGLSRQSQGGGQAPVVLQVMPSDLFRVAVVEGAAMVVDAKAPAIQAGAAGAALRELMRPRMR